MKIEMEVYNNNYYGKRKKHSRKLLYLLVFIVIVIIVSLSAKFVYNNCIMPIINDRMESQQLHQVSKSYLDDFMNTYEAIYNTTITVNNSSKANVYVSDSTFTPAILHTNYHVKSDSTINVDLDIYYIDEDGSSHDTTVNIIYIFDRTTKMYITRRRFGTDYEPTKVIYKFDDEYKHQINKALENADISATTE